MRKTILIEGARENNLKNVRVEIPRDQLIVVTGMSGSGKSSLAFDTMYAEGQRRLLESMSSYARRFVDQLKKPDVDFVLGLSPVISIDQKTISKNPRSTVGTMTDIAEYLRMLYASTGTPRCPACEDEIPVFSPHRMVERMLSLPGGTEVEVRSPVVKIYGEDYDYLFEHIRSKGYRHIRIDGELQDIGDDVDVEEDEEYFIEVIIDHFVIKRGIDKQILTALEHGIEVGAGLYSFHLEGNVAQKTRKTFYQGFGCDAHHSVAHTMHPAWFTFNDAAGACPTCSGLGIYLHPHPDLLVPDKTRTLRQGAIIKEALNNDKNSWGGRTLHSVAQHFEFSLDVPWNELPKKVRDILLHGAKDKITIVIPEGAKQGLQHEGKEFRFQGVIPQLENHYRWYRKHGTAHGHMEDFLRKVMVEYDCPACGGGRLKKQRRLVTVGGKNLHQLGEMHLVELREFVGDLEFPEHHAEIAEKILREVRGRLDLLIDIGLDYLSLNRRSATLSGGESQRIRLSTQIGSGLMGMLYVLDEPSIGLHPKDNAKMVATLRRLRDIGNTVVVVEHDEETIRAADHIIEIGPGPGIHGGEVVAQGNFEKIVATESSVTGQFLSGRRVIAVPKERRKPQGDPLVIRGARHNNLRSVDVEIPLNVFTCVTGASGSGKSSLIHEVLYKKLYSLRYDSRVLSGEHDDLLGWEQVDDVIDIDQSPIGRSPRSNPATYIGFYDNVRKLFASSDEAKARNMKAAHFSFNVKGGRCEECGGQGTILTKLSLMPDVETTCPTCKGARYKAETLEVTVNGKNIAEVLELSIEEGLEFFADQRLIRHKLNTLFELGLGYLKIGHPATLLSGGEAQRVKLANELGKIKRGKRNLYILDEPTTGLHLADIQRLLDSLNRLVDAGHTVIVIEHHLDVIKTADHVVDLGPEGGHKGGRLMAQGVPETIASTPGSLTGEHLRPLLRF